MAYTITVPFIDDSMASLTMVKPGPDPLEVVEPKFIHTCKLYAMGNEPCPSDCAQCHNCLIGGCQADYYGVCDTCDADRRKFYEMRDAYDKAMAEVAGQKGVDW